ncbi:hypothetical protein EON65_45285 [archaeon]|nr:MAG: hypothetical protein EON65_45285 [archaeon]
MGHSFLLANSCKQSPAAVQIQGDRIMLFIPGTYRIDAEGDRMPVDGHIAVRALYNFAELCHITTSTINSAMTADFKYIRTKSETGEFQYHSMLLKNLTEEQVDEVGLASIKFPGTDSYFEMHRANRTVMVDRRPGNVGFTPDCQHIMSSRYFSETNVVILEGKDGSISWLEVIQG